MAEPGDVAGEAERVHETDRIDLVGFDVGHLPPGRGQQLGTGETEDLADHLERIDAGRSISSHPTSIKARTR